jgi:CRP/FNR family transcriptional regulator
MKRLQSTKEKTINALQENRYLSGLDNLILEFLAENTQLISFEAEESIIREGQLSLGLYFLESGRVKIFKYSSSGREMIINVLDAGESFNEVPVFDQLDNPVNVSTVVDTLIWLIDA